MDDPKEMLKVTQSRIYGNVLGRLPEGSSLAAVPLTPEEVKEMIAEKFRLDELGAIGLLRQAGS